MIIFVPYYNRGWNVEKIDTDNCVIRRTPGYPINIQYRGIIYNGNIVFDNESDAYAWINDKHHMEGRIKL